MEELEAEVKKECMKNGGSISHHHGVGKLKRKFIKNMMSPFALEMQKRMKATFDPKDVFGIHNTYYVNDQEEKDDLHRF